MGAIVPALPYMRAYTLRTPDIIIISSIIIVAIALVIRTCQVHRCVARAPRRCSPLYLKRDTSRLGPG